MRRPMRKLTHTNATQSRVEREVPSGHIRVEAISGPEGPCLSMSHNNRGGLRVGGPKPWGGGEVFLVFDVRVEDVESVLAAASSPSTEPTP
jgi:hypothetical protein